MVKPSSRLPLLLGALLVLAAAGAAIMVLLPQDAPPAEPARRTARPAAVDDEPARPAIEAFDSPAAEVRETPPPAARQLGLLSGRLLTPDRRPVPSGRIELLEGIPMGLGGLSQLPRLGPRGEVDADGRFLIADVPTSDEVVVRAFGDSFETTESGPHLVRQGQTCDIGVVIVDPGLTVRGTISDPRGRGVAGAQVALTRGRPLAIGRDAAEPERVVLTDERGGYVIPHGTRGPFSLLVSAAGFGNASVDRGVQLDDPRQMEINVHLQPAKTLEGVVLLPGGSEPAIHVEVLAEGGELGQGNALVRTDAEGRFRFTQLAAGRHLLRLDPEGYLPVSEEVLPGSREGITIELRPASSLSGTVTDTKGKPLRAFDLQLRKSDKRGNVREAVGASLRVRNSEGRFEVGDLVPGWYLIEVWARGHSVTISNPARVRKGDAITELTVAMQRSSALLGSVVDDLGQPIAGAEVSLHTNNTPTFGFLRASASRGSWHTSTSTRSDGTFKFSEVTARTYQIEVDHPRYPMVHRNDVAVVPGEETELSPVILDRPAILSGVVSDNSGQILKGVTVTLGGGNNRATRQVVSDGEGRYRFERLAPGDYQVHAYAPTISPIGVLLSNIHRIQRDPEGKPLIPTDITLQAGEEREYNVTAQG